MKKSIFSFSLGVGIMAVLAIFVWVGQGNSQPCVTDEDCPAYTSGQYCEDNTCKFLSCTIHYDCPNHWFCYKGDCLKFDEPFYHCGKPGCPPGKRCSDQEGKQARCPEDESYVCENACDCGAAHACIEIEGVGKRCIKDVDDAWLPGGTAIFDATIPDGEPTYCCDETDCYTGRGMYLQLYWPNISGFVCYEKYTQSSSNYCGGKPCYYSGDCEYNNHVCCDVYSLYDPYYNPRPRASCSWSGGRCVTGATAEGLYGHSYLIPCTECIPEYEGEECELGWKPGGAYVIQIVIGKCGSCPNGICDDWEDFLSCPQDCQEPVCGDGNCTGLETPKNCPEDCQQLVCGDGSCDSSEVTSCPQDCGCPDSPNLVDHLSLCGDGYCDPNPYSLENCSTCPQDCGAICPVALCQNVTVNADLTCAASASIDNGSNISDGSQITLTQSPPGPYPKGTTSVTLMVANSQGGSSQCTGTVTVVDNTPPSIIAPAAVTAYTGPESISCEAVVDDATLGTVMGSDNCPGVTITQSGIPSGNIFPVGTTTITYTATDASGNMATAPQSVTVIDNGPPQITNISANPSILWPPNHKMVDAAISYNVVDNCASSSNITCTMSVTSNEPINRLGDGDTSPDWEVVDSNHVKLRAERAGNGTGRIYKITVMCIDSSSNPSNQNVTVSVPKDKGKK